MADEVDQNPRAKFEERQFLRSETGTLASMAAVCTCSLLRTLAVGTRTVDGVQFCNSCELPTSVEHVEAHPAVSPRMMSTTPDLPGHRVVAVHGVVHELAATSGTTASSKGDRALDAVMAKLARAAAEVGANAVIGISVNPFGAAGGITSAFGGDAVGALAIGTAVTVETIDHA